MAMFQRKSLTLIAGILLALNAPATQAAHAMGVDDPNGPGLDTALVDSSAEVYGSTPGRSGSASTRSNSAVPAAGRTVRTYVPACEGNWPDSPNSLGTLCPRAFDLCAGTSDPEDLGFWVFTAPAGANRTAESWTATGEYACRGATDADEPEALEPVVTAEDFRRLPLPAADINDITSVAAAKLVRDAALLFCFGRA